MPLVPLAVELTFKVPGFIMTGSLTSLPTQFSGKNCLPSPSHVSHGSKGEFPYHHATPTYLALQIL